MWADMAREVPIEIWRRSNDPPVIWEFLDEDLTVANLDGYEFEVYARWPADTRTGIPAGSIKHDTSLDTLDLDRTTGRLYWRPTLAENAAIPRTGARYELFSVVGDLRRMWCGGTIVMRGFL